MRGKIRLFRADLQAMDARLKLHSPAGRIRESRSRGLNIEERLAAAMKKRVTDNRHRLALYIEKLKGLSPLDKLNQGYSYVADEEGKTVTDIEKIAVGDRLWIYVRNGRMQARVTQKVREERNKDGS